MRSITKQRLLHGVLAEPRYGKLVEDNLPASDLIQLECVPIVRDNVGINYGCGAGGGTSL